MVQILQETSLEKEDKKQYKKVWLILIAIFTITTVLILNSLYYIDPINGCFITVEEDVAGGSKEGVYKSLNFIKKNNPENYKTVCNNVTNIIEKYCFYMDPRVRTAEEFKRQGCYIKGSKTIYILPNFDTSETTTKSRAQDILKYTKFSEEYWRNK